MYPYIKIGPIILWTYGLTGGVAILCAWKLLEINLRRHDLPQRVRGLTPNVRKLNADIPSGDSKSTKLTRTRSSQGHAELHTIMIS